MNSMHDPVVITKKTSRLPWLVAAMTLGLFACQVEDNIVRDNPGDAAGANYHLPTVSVTTPADTTFRDSSSLRIRVRDSSANSRVVRLRWTLDGTVSDSTTDTTWHPTSGLSEGQHVIVVRAVDSTGLVSLPDTVRVKVYNKPPALTHVRDTTLSANKPLSIKLSATDSDGTVSKFFWGTTKGIWTDSTGTVALSPMAEGAKKIYWSARDDLGKTTTDSFAVTFVMDRPVLTVVSDTTVSASKALVVPLNARPLGGSFSAVTKYLWSTNGSTWDSSNTASANLSDTAGGTLAVQWQARNSLGNFSKPDTFVVTFLHAPTITSLSVDSNLTSWTGSTGTLNFSWAGSIAGFPDEVIAWTLYGGTNGNLAQLYSGNGNKDSVLNVDSGVNYSYRLVGKNVLGDSSVVMVSRFTTSYAPQPIAANDWNTSIRYGIMQDSRDGQSYWTVKIGSQRWMAQNLNYRNAKGKSDTVGVCYNDADSCTNHGRLYSWAEAMGLSAVFDTISWNDIGVNHQGICPSGWHVPSNAEWGLLISDQMDSITAGASLKSRDWLTGSGTDVFGFRALSAGFRDANGVFRGINDGADFWSASAYEDAANVASSWHLEFGHENVERIYHYKSYSFSLRCVKDN